METNLGELISRGIRNENAVELAQKLLAQRDELAEALRNLLDTEQMDDDEPPLVEARKQARAVLSKVQS